MLKNRRDAGQLPTGLVLPRSLVPRTIKRLHAYRWADNTKSDGQSKREIVFKKNDDIPDALRYALMTYPTIPTGDPEQKARGRDLSLVDDTTRMEILRERKSRVENPDEERMDEDLVPVTGMGDFAM